MEETKLIYAKRLAYKLMEAGNVVKKTIPNYNKEGFIIWSFIDTPKLQADIAKYHRKY